MSDPDSLSAEDLRDRLYHSLREKGLVDALKSQLRNRLVTELKTVGLSQSFHQEPKYAKEGSLLHKAANSLVADHLRRCQYEYSLSVFLPESGNSEERLLTVKDLLQLLNISPQSQLYKQLESSATEYHKKGFLWQLLCEIASQCGHNKRETGVQTDHMKFPPPTSLEEEFRKLDTHYASVSDDWRSRGSLIEERILAYQKQLEDRTRNEFQLEKARFKENELARMRVEEQEKCRKELESTRKEMERTYRAKSAAVLERERHAAERLKQQEEMTERESYSKRQAVLDEIEAVRQKEGQLRREQEHDKREKELWEQKIKTREQAAKERHDTSRKLEIEYEQKLRNDVDKYKIEEQARYLDRYKNVEYRESRVKENERRLDDELQTIKQTKDELRAKRLRVNEVESDLVKCQHDLIGARKQEEILSDRLREMVDYQILKEESAVLRKELEHAKQRAAESNRDSVISRQKHEELLREMTERASKPTPEAFLMKQQLEKAQNELKQERAVFDHHRSQQERRLQEEIQRNHELLQKLEENTLQQKHMNREMNDVHSQLFSTRQALSNEVYRKPKSSAVTSQILALQESLRLDKSDSMCSIDGELIHGDAAAEDEGPAGPDLMYDDPIIDDILSHAPAAAAPEPSQSDDYSYSSDLVQETKRRLKGLEREAEHLEENYRNFQYRMTSVHTALETEPIRPSPNRSRVSFRENIGMPITSTTREALRSPYSSPRHSQANVSRPMSSTPARSSVRTVSDRHLYSSPVRDLDRDQSLINARMSPVHSPRQDQGPVRQRPLSVEDLEARPGSPSVVVVPGSGSSSGHQGDMSFQDLKAESRGAPPAAAAAPVSLDGAWRQTQQELQVSLDSAWKDQEAERVRQEEEDRQYEEQKRKREEERKRREEEAWEREQRELERLEGKQAAAPKEEKPKEEEQPAAGIDPVMQKYMEMVKQQKEKEKQIVKKTITTWNKGRTMSQDKTPSQSEDLSLGSGGVDKSDTEPAGDDDFW